MFSYAERTLAAIYKALEREPDSVAAVDDAFSCIRDIGEEQHTIQIDRTHELQGHIKRAFGKTTKQDELFAIYRRSLCYCAPESFDDFVLYMEIDRPYDKQFYLPRRKQLKRLVDALEKLERRELEMLGISLPPGVGKTTLAEFFLTWTGGRHPEMPILTGSHNGAFLRGMYGEILRFLDPEGEYKFCDVFPELKVINTSALDLMIDLGKSEKDGKRFMTFEFSSIGSGNAGKVRAGNLLYCDDLVSNLEEALSRDRMNKLYEAYSTDLRQRKIGNCAELHIATRWSVHDVIGRLERMNADNPKAEFIVCPALDENDESNFDYPIAAGLTTKFLHEQREAMDDASFRALYMNQPYEREGQLYNEDKLRRYFDLPAEQPDAIIAVCDTKSTGADYCVMPIAYQYGEDYYIEAVVCEDYSPEIVDANLIKALVEHNVQMCQFESNAAGGRTAEKVQQGVREKGGITRITTKWTQANKETKIIVNSPWVMEHCLFKDNSKIRDNKEYRQFIGFLCTYTLKGKNAHDDVPDAMAQFALYAQSFITGRAEVVKSPFWR